MNHGEEEATSARDEDFLYIARALQEEPEEVAITLRTLLTDPLADVRVVPYLKGLLTDTTLCVLSIPYRYGEMRWLAAHALRAEYDALGIDDMIELHDVVRPLDFNEIYELGRAADVAVSPPYPSALEMLATLREAGKVPLDELCLG
ncbi:MULTISPECIES: hypothetical protein [unclassified Nocardia]|uniref:hypothetical protein n=1 Tax=unclassified Nocardia TaxID=2637762 RepID=UPI00278C6A79|nr:MULTISPECIES: hypothetical protein [unclassified Nocardia]